MLEYSITFVKIGTHSDVRRKKKMHAAKTKNWERGNISYQFYIFG